MFQEVLANLKMVSFEITNLSVEWIVGEFKIALKSVSVSLSHGQTVFKATEDLRFID